MGKMGDAASLGIVALAALVYMDLRKFKVSDLLGLKAPPPPDEFTGIPGPGSAPGFNIWNLFGNGNGEGNGNDGGGLIDTTAIDETLAEIDRVKSTWREFEPMPTLEDLGLKSPEYFEERAEYHAEKLRVSKALWDVQLPAFEAQLEAFQANLGELSYMVKGHDAGGDIDMTRTDTRSRIDVGAMLQPI